MFATVEGLVNADIYFEDSLAPFGDVVRVRAEPLRQRCTKPRELIARYGHAALRDDALSRGIRTLKVTYEDLVKDKGAGLERVAKFVSAGTGCDAAGFTYTGEEASWHVVHPHPMSSYVADWRDVVSTLRGTRFEKFLAMDGSSSQ